MATAKQNKDVSGTKPEETAAEQAAPAAQDAKRRPLQSFYEGDVSVSIWASQHVVRGEPRTFYSCAFERRYKDRDDAYRYTTRFDRDDLGAIVALAKKASEYIRGLEESPEPEAQAVG